MPYWSRKWTRTKGEQPRLGLRSFNNQLFISHLFVAVVTSVSLLLLTYLIRPIAAQVVQLPAYRTFGYSGSAWVPDQGTVPLAGNYSVPARHRLFQFPAI